MGRFWLPAPTHKRKRKDHWVQHLHLAGCTEELIIFLMHYLFYFIIFKSFFLYHVDHWQRTVHDFYS